MGLRMHTGEPLQDSLGVSLFLSEDCCQSSSAFWPFSDETDSPASLDMVCSPAPQGSSALHKDPGSQKPPKPSALCPGQRRVLGEEALTQIT